MATIDFFSAMLVHLAHLAHLMREGDVPFYKPASMREEPLVTPETLRACFSHNYRVKPNTPFLFVDADALLDVMEESLLLWNAVTLADRSDFCTAYDDLVLALEAAVNH